MIDIQPEEKIILEVRRHWYVLLWETFVLVLLALIPLVAFLFFLIRGTLTGEHLGAIALFFFAGWLLLDWVLFFIIWTIYYLDVLVITDKRMVNIEQHHLFSREVSEGRLDRIQDVTVEVHGILPTMLHFGDIRVQTAGEAEAFLIRYIPYPDKVRDVIFKQQDELLKKAAAEHR